MSEEPQKPLSIQLFGRMAVSVNGHPISPTRYRASWHILGYLALCYDSKGINRYWLAELFWPGGVVSTALTSLRACLSDIRKVIGDQAYRVPDRDDVFLDIEGAELDLMRFDHDCAVGSISGLQEAIELYENGLLLEDWDKRNLPKHIQESIASAREDRRHKYFVALTALAEDAFERQAYEETIGYLDKAINVDLVDLHDEILYRHKIESECRLGKTADALRTFSLLRSRMPVSGDTQEFVNRIRRGEYAFNGHGKIETKTEASPIQVDIPSLAGETTHGPSTDDARTKRLRGTALSDDIREAIIDGVAELSLFGEAGASFDLYQDLTLAKVSPKTVSTPTARNAQNDANAAHVDAIRQNDEMGISILKDSARTIQSLLRELNRGESAWRLPLLAQPGAGKTTLLHWLVRQAVDEADYLRCGAKTLIPAYISLPDLQGNAADYLASRHNGKIEAEVWEQWLNDGDCLLLLDGLELARDTASVRSLLRAYKNCPAILTCRTVMRERMEAVCAGPYYVLEPLNESQQIAYISLYPRLSQAERVSLQRIVREHAELRLLFSNPFVLSLLCFVAKRNGIPDDYAPTRTSLYSVAIKTLLRERPREPQRLALRRNNPVQGDQMREALGHAALYATANMLDELCQAEQRGIPFRLRQSILQKANSGVMPLEMLNQGLKSWQEIAKHERGRDLVNPMLADLCANSHILSGDPTGVFTEDIVFTHRTLQEYLIAAALAGKAEQAAASCPSSTVSAKANAGWDAIRRYVAALSWLPEFEETMIFLSGSLLERGQFLILERMLSFLGDEGHDDQFHHRLSLAARCIPELTKVYIPEELRVCLESILQRVIAAAMDTITYTFADRSSLWDAGFPFWLEGHPIGRALFAVGSAYSVGKDGKRIGIPIGTEWLDPANLNAELLDEDHLPLPPPVGLRNFERGQRLPKHADPISLLVQQSWMLTLLGPALALPPVRDKLLARAGNFTSRCIAYPISASLRYSGEEDCSRWFAWFRHMITNFKGGMIYCLAPVFSQTSTPLRGKFIEELSSYLDATPADARREQNRDEYLQDYIAFVLSYLLRGDITDGLRQKARSVLDKVPHPCAGLCLLNLGHPGDIQETLADWRKDRRESDSHQGYITALRFWAGEVSLEEALPDITKNLGTLVFDSPVFVRALTEEQQRAILSELLRRGMKDEAFVRLYEEKIGIIANSGRITNRNWLRTELLEHLCLQHSERIDDSLWRTLLQLGEDTIGATELQEHIRCVALAGDRGWSNPYWGYSQKLISMSGTVATHENSIRSALETALRGVFLPEFYQDYQMREIEQRTDSLDRVSYQTDPGSIMQRLMMKPIVTAYRKRIDEIANRPATSLKLPGCREVQYAAAVALSRGGVDFFTEDIRRFIHQSCRSRIGNSVTREDWGVKINRGYKENQHPWLGWIQAGMRIVPDLNGRTEVLLTIELAARAFQQNAPNGDARETVAPA